MMLEFRAASLCLAVFFAGGLGSTACAQAHLEPEDFPIFSNMSFSFWGQFPQFTPYFHKNVLAVQVTEYGMIFGPSAVGIERDGAAGYRLFGVKSETVEGPLRKHCTVPITGSLPQRLVKAWTSVLMETRYGKEPYMGNDGVVVHFAVQGRGQVLSGKLWSPQMPTKPGILWRISLVMERSCESRSITNTDRGEIEDYLSRLR